MGLEALYHSAAADFPNNDFGSSTFLCRGNVKAVSAESYTADRFWGLGLLVEPELMLCLGIEQDHHAP